MIKNVPMSVKYLDGGIDNEWEDAEGGGVCTNQLIGVMRVLCITSKRWQLGSRSSLILFSISSSFSRVGKAKLAKVRVSNTLTNKTKNLWLYFK